MVAIAVDVISPTLAIYCDNETVADMPIRVAVEENTWRNSGETTTEKLDATSQRRHKMR
jgi:hypothetical protein